MRRKRFLAPVSGFLTHDPSSNLLSGTTVGPVSPSSLSHDIDVRAYTATDLGLASKVRKASAIARPPADGDVVQAMGGHNLSREGGYD